MSCFIISYDLRAPYRDYNLLYNAIKSYGTWGRLTESIWAIVVDSSSEQVRNPKFNGELIWISRLIFLTAFIAVIFKSIVTLINNNP